MSYQIIVDYLKQLLSDLEQFLVISPKDIEDVYIQFIPITEEKLYCETVSNQFLPDEYQLNSSKISQLQQLGFQMGDEDLNYNRDFDVQNESSLEELAKLVLKIFVEIYEIIIDQLDFDLDS